MTAPTTASTASNQPPTTFSASCVIRSHSPSQSRTGLPSWSMTGLPRCMR